jgi:hypothetical protein
MIFAPDLGIVGDGKTDCTDGLLLLREQLLTDRDRRWEVEFPPGHYLTRAPHWLDGVGRVRLIGYGATLQQMMPNYGLFSTSEPFRTVSWTEPFTQFVAKHHAGNKIMSAEAGATRLAFVDAAAPGIAPGTVVLVAGRIQQFQNLHLPEDQWQINGWPPNLRYFEFHLVRDSGKDFVELQRPLAHSYDSTWRDYPGEYFGAYVAGAPRLYLCNRPGFDIPVQIEMLGFSFARAMGSTAGAGHIGFAAALQLHLEDCTIQDELGLSCFIQMNDRVTLRRCRLDDLEIDKGLCHVLIEDCDVAGLTSDGAGALEIEVRRSRICGDFRINPRTSVTIDNATAFSNFSLNPQHGGYFETEPFRMTMRATRA